MARIIYDTSEETQAREIARLREKALHDEASALRQAKDEGRVEGIAIGKERQLNAMIEKMRAMGMTEEQGLKKELCKHE